MKKILLLCGIAAPIVYVAAVILGGIMRPGYSHTAQAISELIETDAPNTGLLNPLFAVYNLLTIAFAAGIWLTVRETADKRARRMGYLGASALFAAGVFGFTTLFFPMDPHSILTTSTGVKHATAAGLNSLATMLTLLFTGLWLRKVEGLHRFATYTFVSDLVVLIAGGLAAASTSSHSPLLGLFERITIGAYIQWLLVVALKLYFMQRSTHNTVITGKMRSAAA